MELDVLQPGAESAEPWLSALMSPPGETPATFQVFEDMDNSDDQQQVPDDEEQEQQVPDDEEQGNAVWLDDVVEDLMRSSDPWSPCCLLACSSRGRQCFMAMMSNMSGDREQEEEQPEPPPAVACTPPRAGRGMWRRSKLQCDEHGLCCGKHEERNTEPGTLLPSPDKPLSPMNAEDAESAENANDEVMEWNKSTGEVPAEIWEMVEENDGCLDGCDETASVSQPSGDREPVTCHKLTQTELRREEVGVQT